MVEDALFEAWIDIDRLSFDDVMSILRGYVERLLSGGESGQQLAIGDDMRARSRDLLDRVNRREDPDPDACEADRVAGWKLHDATTGPDKLFAALLVLCTYDRDSAEFDTLGPDAMIESIMTSVCALGDGRGLDFVDHARRSVPGQRCRRAAMP